MEKQTYSIRINAPREKVWNALWDLQNYREWTKPFSADSHAETDNWKKGTDVKFGDGKGNGMVARVIDNRPNEYMSFEHYGEIKDGVVDTESERVKSWAGAHENYTLKGENGSTELVVDLDMNDEWKGFFDEAWPKALDKVKELAEK
jgi:uncharacterized protein YndB with AHSA1/START domain